MFLKLRILFILFLFRNYQNTNFETRIEQITFLCINHSICSQHIAFYGIAY